jgi:hypothetical protein
MAPAIVPLIIAGISAATAGVAIAEQPSAPKAPSQSDIAKEQAQAATAAAEAQAAALKERRGMASTVLTSPFGTSGGITQKATLGA